MGTKVVGIRISEKFVDKLKDEAVSRNRSVSFIVKEAISLYFTLRVKQRKQQDRWWGLKSEQYELHKWGDKQ